MNLNRRQFVTGAGALGATAALGAYALEGGDDPAAPSTTTTSAAPRRPVPAADGTLVVVTLYGGNDGLNTVVPVADPAYRSLRGQLALDPAATHDVGEGFALHPALAECKKLWDAGRLAVVHGVGFDGLDRSHFHCMDVWQAGGRHDTSTGWVGRWLDVAGTEPLDAVVVSRRLPLLVRGDRRSAAVVPPGPFTLPRDGQLRGLLSTLAAGDADTPIAAAVTRSTADLLSVVDTVSPLLTDLPDAEGLGPALETVATLMEADVPTRVYAVDLDGFDTHAAQAGIHENLLAEVDEALGAFLARVGDRDVTAVVYSEFGRRVAANASAGTDHGGAGTVLVAGKVRPGHHGEPPPLDRLVDGDLATTVDFRAVYAGLVEGVLGVPAADLLGPGPAPLPLV